jgi:hypothetical protein
MSELPPHPDLSQLRRQARELLRAATAGEPEAMARLRAYSAEVKLSSAQLAVAREHGFPSWPVLRAEAQRRLQALGAPEAYWSLGGARTLTVAAGELSPSVLLVGPRLAILEASLTPPPGTPANWGEIPKFDDLAVTDDRRGRYAASGESASLPPVIPGQPRPAASLSLRVEPVPARGVRWVELRGQDGTVVRLVPSARPAIRVGELTPILAGPAERELTELATWLIGHRLSGSGDGLGSECSRALARTQQIRRSGEPGAAGQLPDQVARLCAALTGSQPVSGLPSAWRGMLEAAGQADGPRYHLDLPADLPLVDGTTVLLGTLVSAPGSWRLHFRAQPDWFKYSPDYRHKRQAVMVDAVDDHGGTYLSSFGGSTGRGEYESLALEFRPRLDPAARLLTLTFSGAAEQVEAAIVLSPGTEAPSN